MQTICQEGGGLVNDRRLESPINKISMFEKIGMGSVFDLIRLKFPGVDVGLGLRLPGVILGASLGVVEPSCSDEGPAIGEDSSSESIITGVIILKVGGSFVAGLGLIEGIVLLLCTGGEGLESGSTSGSVIFCFCVLVG